MQNNISVIHILGQSNIADYLSRHSFEDKYDRTKMLIKFSRDHINLNSTHVTTLFIIPKEESISETLNQAIQLKGKKNRFIYLK